MRYVFLAAALLPLLSCAKGDYSAKAIEAWVVDADSKQPLEGVIVVAHWQLEYGLEGGSASQLVTFEAVTDKNGRFTFPAWGPKKVPEQLPKEARLKRQDPEILMFKAGYDVSYKTTKSDPRIISDFSGHGSAMRGWFANGDKIELAKISNIPRQALAYKHMDKMNESEIEAFFLHSLDSDLQRLAERPACNWREFPRIIAAAEIAKRNLLKRNERVVREAFFGQRTLYEKLTENNGAMECGSSPDKLFEGLKE